MKFFTEEDQLPDGMEAAFFDAVRKLRRRAGVVAIDVGYRWVNGEMTDELAIRVHVIRKLPFLARHQLLPRQVGGFPIDVLQSRIEPQCESEATRLARRLRQTLAGGVHCGITGSEGTLGMLVTKHQATYFLAARHVVCPGGVIPPGVHQPGPSVAGSVTVGTVAEQHVATDSALVRVNGGVSSTAAIYASGDRLTGTRYPYLHPTLKQIVRKSGVATGVSEGVVDGKGLLLRFFGSNKKVFTIASHDGCPVGVAGDSGSIWYEPSAKRAVGLHIAGTDQSVGPGAHAFATEAPTIFAAFGVTPLG